MSKSVATFNLIVQLVLMAGVFAAAWLGRRRKFGRHCLFMRVLMAAQILLIGIVMAPQLGRYAGNWSGVTAFSAEIVVHHAFGLVALALWVYINLAMTGVVKAPRRYTWFMRSALASWVVSLGLGVHLFWYIWL